MVAIRNKQEKSRFLVVGGLNTFIDFGVLFLLSHFGMASVLANYISTTLAFSFSFFANKKYTFQVNKGNTKRQLGLFLIVTLIGLWVIQPVIIICAQTILSPLHLSELLFVFIPKIIATVATLIWNYVLYSRLVFKRPNS